ncbi:MAG TPA: hypothetical protein VFS78_17510 [Vicinamibacteria bacterium]|nr:hypothetical protein [Vicinamibacteria bacterium]
MSDNPASEAAMQNIGRLGTTVLGVYLIAVGVVPYVLPTAVMLVSVLAIVAGVLILLGR